MPQLADTAAALNQVPFVWLLNQRSLQSGIAVVIQQRRQQTGKSGGFDKDHNPILRLWRIDGQLPSKEHPIGHGEQPQRRVQPYPAQKITPVSAKNSRVPLNTATTFPSRFKVTYTFTASNRVQNQSTTFTLEPARASGGSLQAICTAITGNNLSSSITVAAI